jgi:hypothetical protein
MALLEQKTQAAAWYPIQVYTCLRELLQGVEGRGQDQYSIDAGAASARRLIEAGLYQQLDYLKRWQEYVPTGDRAIDQENQLALLRRQIMMVGTIHDSMFNFGTRKAIVDPEFQRRLQLETWEDGLLTRACRLAVLGFWNEISLQWSRRRKAGLWYMVHHPDHYLMRMTRDVDKI